MDRKKENINGIRELETFIQNATIYENTLEDLSIENVEDAMDGLFPVIGLMKNLKRLAIHYTSLSVIPESICQLTNLRKLSLFGNQIVNIPSSIGNLKNLVLISLSHNQIEKIPSSFGHLINLQTLYLHKNRLKYVPAFIGKLTNLYRLVLAQNQITEIPSSITKLTNLEYLEIYENNIASVPESIGNMQKLKLLNLYGNRITVLPETICNLSNDVQLTLFGNPLQKPPIEICRDGIKIIEVVKRYFEDIKKSECTIYSKRIKLILVGESGAGKTSLANALLYGNVENVGPDESTIGLDYHNWVIPEEDLKIRIVDCAGQREYLFTHQFFFTEGALFVLAVDLSKYEMTDSAYKTMIGDWVTIVTSKNPGASILVVPTHLDCCSMIDVNSRCQDLIERLKYEEGGHVMLLKKKMESVKGENKQFDKIQHLLNKRPNFSTLLFTTEKEYEKADFREKEISLIPVCTKGEFHGLQLLRQEIVRLAKSEFLCPIVSHIIPKEWQCLEENMIKVRKSGIQYITIESLRAECKWKLPDDMLFRALVYFNAVGSIEFFPDVEQGRHLVFIDPSWFVDLLKLLFRHDHENTLMYKEVFANRFDVLHHLFESNKKTFLDKGHLSEGLLKCILLPLYEKDVDLPFVNVVEILAKLGLLCKLENRPLSEGELYFIPWFVPEEEPKSAREEWQQDEQESTAKIIATRLEATQLPASIVCGFLVSVQSKAKICIPWKKGFLVINKNIKLRCEITHGEYSSTVTLHGRGEEKLLRGIWQLVLDTWNELDDLIKAWKGIFHCKKCSLCPVCVQKKSSNPSHFTLKEQSDDYKDYACDKCNKYFDCNLISIPKDLSRENESKTLNIERKIKDLTVNEIDEIAKLLDPEKPVIYNWKNLAHYFGYNTKDMDKFGRSYCGGGNPALHFFMKLKTCCPEEHESICFLIECCKKLKRFDVVKFIETQINMIPENATIHDLHDSVLGDLAATLIEKTPIIKCWKNLACLYGFKDADISQIDALIKVPNSFSPTEALFQAIKTSSKGEQPISSLIDILVKMDRNDVVKLIQTFN